MPEKQSLLIAKANKLQDEIKTLNALLEKNNFCSVVVSPVVYNIVVPKDLLEQKKKWEEEMNTYFSTIISEKITQKQAELDAIFTI